MVEIEIGSLSERKVYLVGSVKRGRMEYSTLDWITFSQ